MTRHTGSCLCGAVSLAVEGALPGPDACHCSQCRRWSGHVWASTDIPQAALTVRGGEHVAWFQSSETVRRGFCSRCGSALFWDKAGWDKIGVAMGAFDTPTDTRLHVHIFVADKGDYYDIADDAPQRP
jgi:hypothetical protein